MIVLSKNWKYHFLRRLNNCHELSIVSPFINRQAVSILRHKTCMIKTITRYNLEDFYLGVSQLGALELLLNANGQIRGLQDLHSKLYIFDNYSVIIASANFTSGGLFNNLEFGIDIDDDKVIQEAKKYFDYLWNMAEKNLTYSEIWEWKNIIGKARKQRKYVNQLGKLPDLGINIEGQSGSYLDRKEVLYPQSPPTVGSADVVRSTFRSSIKTLIKDSGPLGTKELYTHMQSLYPSLCDNSIRCTCGGVKGNQPEWMHKMRWAQQDLKVEGVITRANGKWMTI